MAKTIGVIENTETLKLRIKQLEEKLNRITNNSAFKNFDEFRLDAARKRRGLARRKRKVVEKNKELIQKNRALIETNKELTRTIDKLTNNKALLKNEKKELKKKLNEVLLSNKTKLINALDQDVTGLIKENSYLKQRLSNFKEETYYENKIHDLHKELKKQSDTINELFMRLQISEALIKVGDTLDSFLSDKEKEILKCLGGIKWIKEQICSTKLKTKQR